MKKKPAPPTPSIYDGIADLLESMRFAPSSAGVWFESERLLMIHASVFADFLMTFINEFGREDARARVQRIGFKRGVSDVKIVSKIASRKTDRSRIFQAGPQLMSIMGITGAAPQFNVKEDPETGDLTLDAASDCSIESELHLEKFGIGTEPVCWFLNGYATGFCTAALRKPFLVRETHCRAVGHKQCRSIGKPLSAWPDEIVKKEAPLYFSPDRFNANTVEPSIEESVSPERSAIAVQRKEDDSLAELEDAVVGQSASFQVALELIKRIAETDATALLLGETSVGKEILARELHRKSARADKPLITVNCAAIPDELLEAELFGVERGGYTGANKTRLGRFERANGGTLFLDELGTLSLAAQAKVLRAIQFGEIERIGDQTTRKVDIRLIGATNTDLKDAVKNGAFRQDLYYRLNIFPITIPPLRERRGDIRLLTDLFIRRYSLKYNRFISGISVEAMDLIWSYDWPGNVRELENVIERGVVLAGDNEIIEANHIFLDTDNVENIVLTPNSMGKLAANPGSENTDFEKEILQLIESRAIRDDATVADIMRQLEGSIVKKTVDQTNGNLAEAARRLGLTRAQIAYRLERE